jgi:hypothetical protein|tara:strand:- start:3538 stop:4332 length:795 start_codon:yes stop_codon:yes gene_type:complete
MANQVKTPKATPAAKKTGYKVVKKEAPVVLTKIYEIPKGGGIVCKITTETTYYDAETRQVRAIRYCPSEPSIYKDEQNPQSRREHVMFNEGLLIVPENKPNLQAFLDRHPENKANGGNLFQLVDRTRDTEKEVKDEFLAHDAIAMVRNKDMDELLSVAVSLGINITQKNLEIRRELLKEAKARPEAFMRMFDDPRVKCRSAVIQATEFQIIDCKPDGAYWFDSGRLIVSCPAGQDSKDILVRFCLTDKGALVYEELLARLEKLS